MRNLFIVLCSFTFLFSYDASHLQKLKDTNSCIGCDLTNANLSGLSFREANLSESDLSGSDISLSDFGFANFWELNLIM